MDSVDYLNLMTYDFGGSDAEGNAPIEWMLNNINLFTSHNPEHASRILIGLNYYGNCKGKLTDTILGNKFIELLQNSSFELLWNDMSKEHYIRS
jgi:GH18 family chitinase